MLLTRDAILALAPDAASSKAAQGLLSPSKWPSLGNDETAVWGECQGSGAKPYQTQVDLSGPHFKCSCPSRKFPCKHGLAMLLLRAENSVLFKDAAAPVWVTEWLAARAERERKREDGAKKAESKAEAAPEDAEAAAERDAKRQSQRWRRIEQGCDELERWIGDIFRRGLGTIVPGKLDDWSTMAARLVDAQAPGLGGRLRQAAELVGSSGDWPERLLHRLGLLVLAIQAIKRREDLQPEVQADLRALIGWPLEKTEVLTSADTVDDMWKVLGIAVEERDGNLVERRVWLQASAACRYALLLDHAYGGRGFEQSWVTGTSVKARVAFYPSVAPLRALAVEPALVDGGAAESQLAASEWREVGDRLAACPWTPLVPVVLPDVVIAHAEQGPKAIVDGQVFELVVQPCDVWPLMAVTGGQAVLMMAEWDAERLRPLTVFPSGSDRVLWQRSILL